MPIGIALLDDGAGHRSRGRGTSRMFRNPGPAISTLWMAGSLVSFSAIACAMTRGGRPAFLATWSARFEA